jgi:hypothetical protein
VLALATPGTGRDAGRRLSDRISYVARGPSLCMSDTDLLGIVLGGMALLMFVTGIVLVW